jgi:hypothetical protein
MPWIQKKGQKLGYVHNIHLWHSHHAGDMKVISTPHEPHLHAHINLVNLVVDQSGGTPEYIRFNPNVDAAIVRKAWSYAIFKSFAHLVTDPVFYLHYIPLSSRARVSHRLRYCGRSVLHDLFDYYQDYDFSENIPKEYNEFLLKYQNRRTSFGFIRNISALVGEVDAERVCAVCSSQSEKLDPLTVEEMLRKIENDRIPVAIYRSRRREVAIIRNHPLADAIKRGEMK